MTFTICSFATSILSTILFYLKENLLGTYTDLSVQSIFSEASVQNARDPHTFHIIANAGTTSKSVTYSKYNFFSFNKICILISINCFFHYPHASSHICNIQQM